MTIKGFRRLDSITVLIRYHKRWLFGLFVDEVDKEWTATPNYTLDRMYSDIRDVFKLLPITLVTRDGRPIISIKDLKDKETYIIVSAK